MQTTGNDAWMWRLPLIAAGASGAGVFLAAVGIALRGAGYEVIEACDGRAWLVKPFQLAQMLAAKMILP